MSDKITSEDLAEQIKAFENKGGKIEEDAKSRSDLQDYTLLDVGVRNKQAYLILEDENDKIIAASPEKNRHMIVLKEDIGKEFTISMRSHDESFREKAPYNGKFLPLSAISTIELSEKNTTEATAAPTKEDLTP
ncbi:MAG: hypothetical protein COB36_08360 [Alphaproteobacteria bacterium]|nr:MAG: hypothetical protein COB36_08360 [Alphaproteobacteria bacterium]